MMFIGWIAIGLVVYYVLKDNKTFSNKSSEAEELVKHRFIKGEIDEETYLRMKKML